MAAKRTRQRLTTEFKRRVRLVLKTEMSGKNKISAQHPKIMDRPSIDSDVSYNWLKKGLLNAETESNILAIQDQCIRTRNYEKHILKPDVEDRCRCCHGPPETVHHLLSASPELAKREYLYRHDQVCKYVH
ncbi:unnamed protein product [Darwinula stevensoni]|uniref:Uncharacterized protein n=1 Tax=Darwinula stevensoni TaxID=69355 RepID=A0A7R9AF71_9CRUS|nr:unnamed protein product [Darwinula stevensoni]CAG0903005.1 unnamed protein product [Darwinula stevensoni]